MSTDTKVSDQRVNAQRPDDAEIKRKGFLEHADAWIPGAWTDHEKEQKRRSQQNKDPSYKSNIDDYQVERMGYRDRKNDPDFDENEDDRWEFVGREEGKGNRRPSAKQIQHGVNMFKYPAEIGGDPYPHSVIFYINARENTVSGTTALAKGNSGDEKSQAAFKKAQAQKNADYTQQNRAKSEEYNDVMAGTSAIAGGTVGFGLGKKLKGQNGGAQTEFLTGTGGALLGAAVSQGVDLVSTVRLMDAIQLHIPAAQIAQYTANWDEDSLGTAMGLLASGRGDIKDVFSKEGLEFGGRNMAAAIANIPSQMGIGDLNAGAAVEATSKKVNNPYKEQLFKSMGFRKFAFNYVFAPKNQGEYASIVKIVDTFKYHMHPEISPDDLFMIYPSEFDIEYMYRNKENTQLHRISTCALTDLKVTYGSDGQMTSFRDSDGAPNEIALQLSFTELETLTTDRIDRGF
tara:strand:+ start:6502 stop:7875 length:1374 start_codon:yes stop_codon:yes gene_type:complete